MPVIGRAVTGRPAALAGHDLVACPGARFLYANANYALLGAVVEDVTGEPFVEALAGRVLDRVDRGTVRAVRPGDRLADVVPAAGTGEREPVPFDAPGAAGPLAADATGMAAFWHALLAGRLVRQDTVRRMFRTLHPMGSGPFFYGLGVMAYDVPLRDGRTMLWLGHSGGVPGAKAVAAWVPDKGVVMAVALTRSGSAEAVANALVKALGTASG